MWVAKINVDSWWKTWNNQLVALRTYIVCNSIAWMNTGLNIYKTTETEIKVFSTYNILKHLQK